MRFHYCELCSIPTDTTDHEESVVCRYCKKYCHTQCSAKHEMICDKRERRPLRDSEKGCLELIKIWEKAVAKRKLTEVLWASPEAAELVAKYDGEKFRKLKIDFDPNKQKYKITFTLIELRKYILFLLPHIGLTWNIDGTLSTADNLMISNSYLGDESYV
jgi:hypothetical protein